MEYEIYRIHGGREILLAQFVNESDRDICLMAFEEAYPDCKFEARS